MVNLSRSNSAQAHPRSVATRAALLRAGADLLVERPIDAIAIDDIVGAAGVAKGSFFNHFADKHAFAGAIAAEIRGELEQRVSETNADIADPAERMARALLVFVAFALREPRRAIVMLRGHEWATQSDHMLNRGLRGDIGAGIRAGRFPADIEDSGTVFVVGVCFSLLVNLTERRWRRAAAVARAIQVISLVLRGLGIDPDEASGIVSRAAEAVVGPRPAAR